MTKSIPWAAVRAATLVSFSAWCAASAAGQNLLNNGSFTNGLTDWTTAQTSVAVDFYGANQMPSTAVSTKIGGGTFLLRAWNNATVEQAASLAGLAANQNLHVGGYFGGLGNSDARLVVYFRDASGTLVSLPHTLNYATVENRNYETVLMRREEILAVPPNATTAVASIELRHFGGTAYGFADAIFLEPTSAPVTPAPLPLNTELLVNPGFEAGWTPGSPLSLNDVRGWEGVTNKSALVKPYSVSDPLVPSTNVSALVGGDGNLLTDAYGGAILRQRLDVRGNATQIAAGSLAFRLTAFLGGVGTSDGSARVEVRFLDASMNPLFPVEQLGPVTRAARNGETVVMKRERNRLIPGATAYIQVDLIFAHFGGIPGGLAENIGARLVPTTAPLPTPLNTNLVVNGSFETGSLAGSPLTLTDPQGWFGLNTNTVEVPPYGSGTAVPSAGFASTYGLGGLVLKDYSGDAALRQVFDVSADAALIDIGRFRLFAGAWLGGAGSNPGTAEVRIQFLNEFDVLVGGAAGLKRLGPVTAADRNNVTTLLERTGDFAIPAGTKKIWFDLRFSHFGGAVSGLADDLRFVVYDTLLGGPVKYPGTGEDLRLFSGINGAPTTGPGADCKDATAGDVLNLRIESPNGTFDYAPLLLAANVYPTGSPAPTPVIAGLVLDPASLLILVNGVRCGGFGCAAVLPGGTHMNFPIPSGFMNQTVLLQAFALPIPGMTPAANGIFVGTEGHEIRIY